MQELLHACEATAKGIVPILPELVSGYYSARPIPEAREKSHVAFWETRLAGAVPTMLPHETGEAALYPATRRYRHDLGLGRSEQIRVIARRLGITPFTVLLAAYLCWLR